MSYKGFPSSFDRILAVIEAVEDLTDSNVLINTTATVEHLLEHRTREEKIDSEDYVLKWARHRIDGTIEVARERRQQLAQLGALDGYTALIDQIIAQAKRAAAKAPALPGFSSSATTTTAPAAAWTTTPIKPAFDVEDS